MFFLFWETSMLREFSIIHWLFPFKVATILFPSNKQTSHIVYPYNYISIYISCSAKCIDTTYMWHYLPSMIHVAHVRPSLLWRKDSNDNRNRVVNPLAVDQNHPSPFLDNPSFSSWESPAPRWWISNCCFLFYLIVKLPPFVSLSIHLLINY